ncbi:diguanylate cyclase [Maridesulfovibrio sp.]|uniref:diguanylate cyclase n=1 Tax=Maridesulfovibrio sp. TaxID=2795000 RepID=UPI002A18C771|nr:diguanylate cyclase [Maridesulfovibrio sp.]
MENAIKKNEHLFNENQFVQTRIIAEALTREMGGLASTTEVLAGTLFSEMADGSADVSEVRNYLKNQIRKHEVINGYLYYDGAGKVQVEVGRDPSTTEIMHKVGSSFLRIARKEFRKTGSAPYLTFTYVNSAEQLLAFAFPVRNGKGPRGTVIQVINLKPLFELYFVPVRYGDCCASFMLSGRGVVVYDSDAGIIGKNVFQGLHEEFPEVIALDRRMVNEPEGRAEFRFIDRMTGKKVRKLLSWHAARIGQQKYVVGIAVPDSIIAGTVAESRYIHLFSHGVLVVLILLVIYTLFLRWAEQRIKDSEKRLVLAFEGNRDGVWDWNISKSEVYFSPRWKEMLGYKDDEICSSVTEWQSRIHPDDSQVARELLQKHLNDETDFYEGEYRMRCRDGSYKWVLARGRVYARDRFGKPERMIGTNTDITQKKKIEIEILKLSLAVESSPSAVVITDPTGAIEYVNRGFEEITGYCIEEARGRNPSELVKSSAEQDDIYHDLWVTITAGNVWRGELTNRTKGGETYWCRLSISPVLDGYGKVTNYVGIQEDLTELKNKEAELERLAMIDELTGLNNRRHFMELAAIEMSRTVRNESAMCLVFLDIDHFKRVNDTYGHDCGDYVLKEFSTLVKNGIRDIDIFGRIGGEEFSLILTNTDVHGAGILLERLRMSVEQFNFSYRDIPLHITCSFGFCMYSADCPENLEGLLKQADRALYFAKHNGRNTTVFFDDLPEYGIE